MGRQADNGLRRLLQGNGHGVSQGAIEEFSGGEFRSGFFAGLAGSFLHTSGLLKGGGWKRFAHAALAAIVGGTASALAGGDFVNGAISAAMIALYNGIEFEPPTKPGDSITRPIGPGINATWSVDADGMKRISFTVDIAFGAPNGDNTKIVCLDAADSRVVEALGILKEKWNITFQTEGYVIETQFNLQTSFSNKFLNVLTNQDLNGWAGLANTRRIGPINFGIQLNRIDAIAHEFGHKVGLPERYNTGTLTPLPGWEGTLMSGLHGRFDVRDAETLWTRNRNLYEHD